MPSLGNVSLGHIALHDSHCILRDCVVIKEKLRVINEVEIGAAFSNEMGNLIIWCTIKLYR